MLRANEPELGLWLLKTRGDAEAVLACGEALTTLTADWLVRETVGLIRRTFARLEVSSRSLYAIVDAGSCFAGLFFEASLAADRTYMLAQLDVDEPTVVLDETSFGLLPMVNGQTRLANRFCGDAEVVERLRTIVGKRLPSDLAVANGLVTAAPDELDWDEEIRLAIEERVALSPDALTGLEASLRFPGPETAASKIFARLSAWQNWVFNRPNATGPEGALKRFGTGSKPGFDWERV